VKRFVVLLFCIAACEKADNQAGPDAGCAPGAQLKQDAAAMVDVPATAPCSTYQDMIDAGQIRATGPLYRILVQQVPFYPLTSEGDTVLDSTHTLVWGPQLAGDRLGVVGRVDNSENCMWLDASD
jgi:hypothetical protein